MFFSRAVSAEGKAEFRELRLIERCRRCVRVSCGILETLL